MTITPLAINEIDERSYTSEYFHERMGRQLIIFRKAGTTSEGHYHKGISLTKKPEICILLHGTCMVNWRHVNETTMQSTTITGPAKLEIPPYEWHELVMETDCTCIELNSIAEHQADTFYTP
jgi:hypothetical protein